MPVSETSLDNLLPLPLQIALLVTRILERLGIAYLIGGSIASSIHGKPRLTNDLDLVADIKESQVRALVSALETDFYIDEFAVRRALRLRKSFNIIFLETIFKVDIYIPHGNAWSSEELRQRESRLLIAGEHATACYVSNAETTVLQKLHWYRQGGEVSDKQWSDVIGMLEVQAKVLDYEYLKTWAEELQVADLLSRALKDAGSTEPGATLQ